jgi:hypothetical protein
VLPQEGAGNAGRSMRRSRTCRIGNTCVSHHGHTGITRHSPRNGFNGLFRALPGDRAFLPPSPAKITFANLTPASGCQDHTALPSASAPFVKGASASTTSRLTSVTIAIRPSCRGGTAADKPVIWVRREEKYFFKQDSTGGITPQLNWANLFRSPALPDVCRATTARPATPTGSVRCRPTLRSTGPGRNPGRACVR